MLRNYPAPRFSLLFLLVAVSMCPFAVNSVRCFDCRSDEGSCNDGECSGTICIKIETSSRRSDRRTVQKGCSPHLESVTCQKATLGAMNTERCVCIMDFCNGDKELVHAGLQDGNGADGNRRTRLTLGRGLTFSTNYLIMLIFICLFVTGSFSLLIMNTACVHLWG